MTTLAPAVRLLSTMAWTPAEISVSLVSGWVQYVERAVRRGHDPLDVATDAAEWLRIATLRQRPTWAHESVVVAEWPVARLLDYSVPGAADAALVPTLVLPPQAGHGSCIVDYSLEQSQVRTLREAGLTRLWTLDWLPATASTAHCSIEDYVGVLADTVELLGGRVNLVGDCQGGWLAVLYAGLHPEQVNTLTIGGAPIDTHVGDTSLRNWTKLLGRGSELGLYRTLVRLGGGLQKGGTQLLGFKALEPAAEVERLVQLLLHMDEPEFVTRHQEFTNWFEWTQDVPGAFYLWILRHLFLRNELAGGTLEVGGRRVDLATITCPVFLLAGSADHITPPEQVWALADLVSTPAEDVHRTLVTAGHLGLFMGRQSLQEHWRPLMEQVAALS